MLGVDADERSVRDYADTLTHVVQCDSTDPEAMAQIGARDFRAAVVAIGTNIEASILTTSVLVDFGVERIVAKAITAAHGKILSASAPTASSSRSGTWASASVTR